MEVNCKSNTNEIIFFDYNKKDGHIKINSAT